MTRIAWLALALLHFLPAIALVRPSMLGQLYGLDPASPAYPLVWHRAALFGIITLIAVWAAFRSEVRPLATVAVGLSMVSFLIIYQISGRPPALRTIALADLAFMPFLAWVVVAQLRGS